MRVAFASSHRLLIRHQQRREIMTVFLFPCQALGFSFFAEHSPAKTEIMTIAYFPVNLSILDSSQIAQVKWHWPFTPHICKTG
jgi:hypothetical protein